MSQSYNPFYNIENPQLMGYEYAWSSFMRGQGLNNAIISQEIGQSWERCRNGRIQMNFKGNTSNTPGEAPNTQETFLKQTGGKMIADILEAWDNDCFYGIITDAHGKKLFGIPTETFLKNWRRLVRLKIFLKAVPERTASPWSQRPAAHLLPRGRSIILNASTDLQAMQHRSFPQIIR